jgi:hypothetical protein
MFTDRYDVGKKKLGLLGLAHLIIPLHDAIFIHETIGLKNQAIIMSLKEKGFSVRFGDIKCQLDEVGDEVHVEGAILLAQGEMHFSGKAENKKGQQVSLANTKLVGMDVKKDVFLVPSSIKRLYLN